eukprot:jgi/Botrbrau1/17385/Bobra.0767s0001.1
MPNSLLPGPLAHVSVCVSGVVAAPIEDVWSHVRVFGGVAKWLPTIGAAELKSELLPGQVEGQIGCIRRVIFDNGLHAIVEQLVALDDADHVMKYKVISHPLNKNPFPGSFLNFSTTITLRKITLGNGTFMEWMGEFHTESSLVDTMKSDLRGRFEAGFQGLANLMLQQKAVAEQLLPTANGEPLIGSIPLSARKSGASGSVPPVKYTPPIHGISPPNLALPPRAIKTQAGKPSMAQDMATPMDVHPAAPLAATAAQYANHAANMLYNTPFPSPQAAGPPTEATRVTRSNSDLSLDSGQTTPLQASPLRGS